MSTITTRVKEGVTILDLAGKFIIGAGAEQMRSAINNALNSGVTKLLLNMSQVSSIDSSGIGELVNGNTLARNMNARLKLFDLPAKVHDLLNQTQLLTLFEVFDNEEEAVASFE